MAVKFTAQGNFRPLQASMRGLNQQMSRSMGGMGAAVQTAINPINGLNKQLDKGQLGAKGLASAVGNSTKMLREHNAIMNSTGQVYHDAAGNARVLMDVNRASAANVATLGQRFRYTNTLMHAFGRNTISVGKNMQWAGRQVMVGLTLPLGLLAAASLKTAEEYDKNMTRIIKVNGEATAAAEQGGAMFDLVSDSIRRQAGELVDLGASMGFLAGETTNMIAEFSQMGYVGAQLDQLTEAALRLSRTSGTDLDTSMELTRLTASAFGVEMENLTQTFANLNLVENNTALSLDEMAKGLPVVAGVAATLGMKVEETAGLMAMMKENGIGANEGATALRTGLLRIVQDATDPAIEAFDKIGLNLEGMQHQMQTAGDGDVMHFFDSLSDHLSSIDQNAEGGQAQLNEFAAAISKMVGVRSSARFLTFLKEVGERHDENTVAGRSWMAAAASEDVEKAADALSVYNFEQEQIAKSAAGIAERLRAELNVQVAELGQNFLEVANMARQFAVNFLSWFNELDDGVKRTTLIFGGFIAALGPVTMLAGIFANAIGQVITIVTKLLPKMSLMTMQQQAMEMAYYDSARAVNVENTALRANIGLKGQAAAAAGANAAAVGGAIPTARNNGLRATPIPGTAVPIEGRTRGMNRKASARAIAGAGSGAGKGASGAMLGAVFIERIKKVLFSIPKSIGKGTRGIAKNFNTRLGGVMAGLVGRLKGMAAPTAAGKVGMAGRAAGGALMAGKAAGFVGGAGAAALGGAGGIAAIVAAIAAIPILADPAAFMESFRNALAGPMERFRELWSGVQTQVQRIMELFRQGGEEGGGLSKMASVVGSIAGIIGGFILDALNIVMGVVKGILEVFEAIMHFAEAIGHILKGEWSEAGAAIKEMFKALGRALISIFNNAVAVIMGRVADLLESFGFGWADDIAASIRGWADGIREAEELQSDITKETIREEEARREMEGLVEGHKEALRESNQFLDEMEEAGINIRNMSQEEIRNNSMITDEMKAQALAALQRLEIVDEISRIEGQISRLQDAYESRGSKTRHDSEVENQLSERRVGLLERSTNLRQEISDGLQVEQQQSQWLNENLEDGADAAGDLGDNLSGSSAEMDALESKAESLRDRIQESEQAAQQWASALQSGVSDVMSDIAEAVQETLQEQQERQEAAFTRRQEQIEGNHNAEREALDDIVAAEEEAEQRRQQYFEQQKARIEYLKGMEQGNVSMQESIARGDVGEAARIRIGLQADAEAYMLNSYERESNKFKTEKDKEMAARRAAVDESEALALRQLEVERTAAQRAMEARRESVERYLEDWQRVTPATQAEFSRHLSALGTNMRAFGIDVQDVTANYTENSGNIMRQGFSDAITAARQAIQEEDKWKAVGENSGRAFRRGLAAELEQVEKDIEDLRSGKNVEVSGSSGDVSTRMGNTTGNARSIFPALNNNSMNRSPNYTGMSPRGEPANRRTTVVSPRHSGSITRSFHTGGSVGSQPTPGLKRDEAPAVLQTGEYVIQRSAVKALGMDYMKMINNASKYHDGGLVDYSGSTIKEGGMLGAASGYALGSLATMGAADFVKAAGVEPKIKSRDTSTRTGKDIGKSAGKQIAEAMKAVAGFAGGESGGEAGWRAGSGQGWPPRKWATLSGNTRAAQNFWQGRASFPGGIGAGVHRGVQKSDHSWGKALDFMVAPLGRMPTDGQRNVGNTVANWHLQNPGAFGTKYVIWDKMINSGDSRGWRPYTRYGSNPGPTLGHYDHVHVSYLHGGGPVDSSMTVPAMRNGGKIKMDNTIANLHRGETVLTAPLTKKFEEAVAAAAGGGGGGNTYNLEINVNDGNLDTKDLAKKVVFEIDKMERSKGRKRVIAG